MISYAEAPLPTLDPVDQHLLSLAKIITEKHQKHIDRTFAIAILNANDGVPPTAEQLHEWCRTYVMGDGTILLTWKNPSEELNRDYVIAEVGPPDLENEPEKYLS